MGECYCYLGCYSECHSQTPYQLRIHNNINKSLCSHVWENATATWAATPSATRRRRISYVSITISIRAYARTYGRMLLLLGLLLRVPLAGRPYQLRIHNNINKSLCSHVWENATATWSATPRNHIADAVSVTYPCARVSIRVYARTYGRMLHATWAATPSATRQTPYQLRIHNNINKSFMLATYGRMLLLLGLRSTQAGRPTANNM